MLFRSDSSSTLPEFSSPFKSVPIFTDIVTLDNMRVTATCCECGQLVVTCINSDNTNLRIWEKQFDGPLTSTKLFFLSPDPVTPPPSTKLSKSTQQSSLNLCVSYALGETIVYHNILDNVFSASQVLPDSNGYDVVTCL